LIVYFLIFLILIAINRSNSFFLKKYMWNDIVLAQKIFFIKHADRKTGWTVRFTGFFRFLAGFDGLTPVPLRNGFAP
jgi:hypothetical protein